MGKASHIHPQKHVNSLIMHLLMGWIPAENKDTFDLREPNSSGRRQKTCFQKSRNARIVDPNRGAKAGSSRDNKEGGGGARTG